jgi:hypothetical protein
MSDSRWDQNRVSLSWCLLAGYDIRVMLNIGIMDYFMLFPRKVSGSLIINVIESMAVVMYWWQLGRSLNL